MLCSWKNLEKLSQPLSLVCVYCESNRLVNNPGPTERHQGYSVVGRNTNCSQTSPPLSSSQPSDRTRTLFSCSGDIWSHPQCRTSIFNSRSARNTRGFWGSQLMGEGIIHHVYSESRGEDSCEDESGIRYWYSSPWNPGHSGKNKIVSRPPWITGIFVLVKETVLSNKKFIAARNRSVQDFPRKGQKCKK